jgi:serine/threonine protein kinase
MSKERETADEIARRIADSESVDPALLDNADPELASGLRKLAALAQMMRVGAAAGSNWGHLQQLELAGQGGFGEVFRAYDPTLDRTVALKLKREDSATLHASGRDFVAEARRLARVRHPHVLAVHGASYHDGRAGLWADWIDGETLSARLARGGPLAGAELLRVLDELAAALVAVHAAGLVHGDVKSSNVMLDRQGHVILMDFGAGFESGGEGSPVSAGTPQYMAPEIAAGDIGSAAVDIYAFGVLAHRLATGHYALAGSDAAQVQPAALARLVASALAREPAARPTAPALRASLQQIIGAPARRTRTALRASLAIGLIGIALTAAVGYQREAAQRRQAEHARDEATATADFLTELLAAPAPEVQGREVKVAELLRSAAQRAQSTPGLSLETRAGLLLTIGRSQLALNQFRSADDTLGQAHALATTSAAIATPIALRIGLALAHVRTRREHYDEADTVLQALAADARWQADRTAVAQIAIVRSGWLQQQGKLDAARAALAPALDPGLTLPRASRIEALAALAQILFVQRELVQTEKAVQQALALLDPATAGAGTTEFELRNLLGNTYSEMGRLRDAEAIYRGAAESMAKAYGENTRSALLPWVNVATVVKIQARYDEALAIVRDTLPKAEALEGTDSALVISLRSVLSSALYESGQIEPALAEYATLIALEERELGVRHPQTLIDRFNRVEALNKARQFETALRDGQVLREDMVAAVGVGHPFTLEADDAIGYALTATGRAAQAEPIHRRTAEQKAAILGADSTYTLLSREYLARALLGLRRNDEARALLDALLRDRERILGAEHVSTVATRALLATLPPG